MLLTGSGLPAGRKPVPIQIESFTSFITLGKTFPDRIVSMYEHREGEWVMTNINSRHDTYHVKQ